LSETAPGVRVIGVESMAHDSYRHEALLWRGDEEFLAGTVPFIQEGPAAGEPVMAPLVPERASRRHQRPDPYLAVTRET
jgi:hypothetical protein